MYTCIINAILHYMTKYYHRSIESLLKKALTDFPVVVITGARQTGKSTMLRNFLPEFRYITLDDPIQRQIIKEDPRSVLSNPDKPLIIDEIQYAPEILSYIKIVVDGSRERKGHFVLTGSQHFNMMAGITESLSGRAAILTLPAFSVTEYHLENLQNPKECYMAILKGFYPEPLIHGIDISLFYGSYLQTYLERDVRQISDISNINLFQTFITQLAARSGSVINLNEISKECGIAFNTAKKWLAILQASGIVYLLKPYFRNIQKRVIKSPKIYFTDTGLMSYILKYQNADTLYAGPSSGSFYETFIVNEFLKFKYNYNAAFDMYFYRDSNGNETDIIMESGGRFFLFEIKAAETLRLEHTRNLSRQLKLFPGSKGYLLGFYEEDLKLNDKVIVTNWTNLFRILRDNLNPDLKSSTY